MKLFVYCIYCLWWWFLFWTFPLTLPSALLFRYSRWADVRWFGSLSWCKRLAFVSGRGCALSLLLCVCVIRDLEPHHVITGPWPCSCVLPRTSRIFHCLFPCSPHCSQPAAHHIDARSKHSKLTLRNHKKKHLL